MAHNSHFVRSPCEFPCMINRNGNQFVHEQQEQQKTQMQIAFRHEEYENYEICATFLFAYIWPRNWLKVGRNGKRKHKGKGAGEKLVNRSQFGRKVKAVFHYKGALIENVFQDL